MKRIISNRRALAAAIAAALAATAAVVMSLVFSAAAPAAGTSNAADKMVVQGTDGEALCSSTVNAQAAVAGNCNKGPTALLTGTIKLSTPKNLIVDVTMDCSTVTDVSTTTSSSGTKSTSSAEAASGVHAWLTITNGAPQGDPSNPSNGYVIPVDPNTSTAGTAPLNAAQINPGDVTFCNRDLFLSQSLTNTSTTSAVTLATTLNIESQYANGFNWVSLPDNNTSNVETVTLWGQTISSGSTSGTATEGAASWVGQRTMIITPANTAQNAQFS